MWLLVLTFLIVTLFIGWTLFGYYLLLAFIALSREKKNVTLPAHFPRVTILIPCYNEETLIEEKLRNLQELDYPGELLEVLFADGGSTDRTLALIERATLTDKRFRAVPCPARGKISQLNHVLPLASGEIIVNTDADARLAKDALLWLAAEFSADTGVMAVGAFCSPGDTLAVERHYWTSQNKGRFLESDACTSSIVIAPCYAFRKELLAAFPDDVVADDVYVAYLANTKGYRVSYSRNARAFETRVPRSLGEFIPHKFRKSNAVLRESLRFIYLLPSMGSFFKMMLLTRIFQQLFLPWTLLLWCLLAGMLLTLSRYDIVAFSLVFLVGLLAATSLLFSRVALPGAEERHSLGTMLSVYLLTNLLMLSTGLTYPFYRQDSFYRRLGTTET